MDIHRCRFVPFPPSPINSVAFSHTVVNKKDRFVRPRLAIGRANGDVEVWNPVSAEDGCWIQEATIHGGKDRSIDGLVWATELDEHYKGDLTIRGRSRLFSIGLTSAVTEWDLEKRVKRCHASGQHGNIWCLALQPFSPKCLNADPKKRPTESRMLVAGTSDGSLVAYSIDDDSLRFDRVLVKTPKKKAKMLSISFQNRDTVAVGLANGQVNIYDLRNGATINQLRLEYKTESHSSSGVIAWAVACIPNNRRDIVVGDSSGHISFIHGKNYQLMQRIQGHKQDILSITVNQDGTAIATGGMDRRTSIYKKSPAGGRWDKMFHARYHLHDVKAMASFRTSQASFLVAGGSDTTPIVIPFENAHMEYHLTLPHLPQSPSLDTAPEARLIAAWWQREIRIWKIGKSVKDLRQLAESDSNLQKNRRLVAKIMVKGESNIVSASLSQDGTLLAVATVVEVKAFRLSFRTIRNGEELAVTKFGVPESLKYSYSKVKLSPDGQWLCLIREGNQVCMAKINHDEQNRPLIQSGLIQLKRLTRSVPKHVRLGGFGSYERCISHIAFSVDSKMIAVTDLDGYIDTWILEGGRMANGVHNSNGECSSQSGSHEERVHGVTPTTTWIRNPNASLIPKLPDQPAVLSFSPHIPALQTPCTHQPEDPDEKDPADDFDDYTLVAVTATGQIHAFHPTLGKLTPWARRHPFSRLPREYVQTKDVAKGITWSGSRAWIWGTSSLFMFDMSEAWPSLKSSSVKAVVPTTEVAVSQNTRDSPDVVTAAAAFKQKAKVEAEEDDPPCGEQRSRKRKRSGKDTQERKGKRKGSKSSNRKKRDEPGPVGIYAAGKSKDVMVLKSGAQEDNPKGLRKWKSVLIRQQDEKNSDDEDEDDGYEEEGGSELMALRRMNGHVVDATAGDSTGEAKTAAAAANDVFWFTRKYRPILGLLPIGESEGKKEQAVEVVLVERPLWDVEMPDRYFGEGEWERR